MRCEEYRAGSSNLNATLRGGKAVLLGCGRRQRCVESGIGFVVSGKWSPRIFFYWFRSSLIDISLLRLNFNEIFKDVQVPPLPAVTMRLKSSALSSNQLSSSSPFMRLWWVISVPNLEWKESRERYIARLGKQNGDRMVAKEMAGNTTWICSRHISASAHLRSTSPSSLCSLPNEKWKNSWLQLHEYRVRQSW